MDIISYNTANCTGTGSLAVTRGHRLTKYVRLVVRFFARRFIHSISAKRTLGMLDKEIPEIQTGSFQMFIWSFLINVGIVMDEQNIFRLRFLPIRDVFFC